MSLLAPGSDGVKSVSNSTTTALAGGATFTGVAETNDFPETTKDVSRTLYGGEKFEEKTDLVFRATSVTNANAIITVSYGLRLSKS